METSGGTDVSFIAMMLFDIMPYGMIFLEDYRTRYQVSGDMSGCLNWVICEI